MQIVIKPLDQIFAQYGAKLISLGDGKTRIILSRALNAEGPIAFRQVKRDLKAQGSFPAAAIAAGVKFKRSTVGTLETSIEGTGKELNIAKFGARQFSYGTRAKVWGKFQTYKSTFVVRAYSGFVYKRKGAKRFPIEQVYGPSIAKEIVKDKAPTGYYDQLPRLQKRVGRELQAVLRGY